MKIKSHHGFACGACKGSSLLSQWRPCCQIQMTLTLVPSARTMPLEPSPEAPSPEAEQETMPTARLVLIS